MQPSTLYPVLITSAAALVVFVAVAWISSHRQHAKPATRSGPPVVSGLFIYPIKGSHGHSVQSAVIDDFGLQHDRRWMIVKGSTGDFVTQRQLSLLAAVTADVCFPDAAQSLLHPSLSSCARRRDAVTVPSLLLHTPLCTYSRGSAPGPCACVLIPIVTEPSSFTTSTIWRRRVEGVCDQGDAASAWLCAQLRSEDLRLVYMAQHVRREADNDFTPAAHAQRVSFADGYPLLLLSEESVRDLSGRVPGGVPINRFRTNVLVAGAPVAYAEDSWTRVRLGKCAQLMGVKRCSRCRVTTIPQEPESWSTLAEGVTVRAGSADVQPLEALRLSRADAKGNVYMGMVRRLTHRKDVRLQHSTHALRLRVQNCIVDRSADCACGTPRCERRIAVGDVVDVIATGVIPPQ